MSESREIELRSEEVQEILSAVPSWLIRYGISLIFVLVLMLIFLSWLIRYPDMTGSANIVTEDLRLIDRVFNTFREVLQQ